MLLRNGMARMQSAPLAYLLYCRDGELRDRLERILAGVPITRVTSRKGLLEPSVGACAVVFGTTACSDEDLEWLRSAFGPVSPPCVVVAPLSVDCLRRLYPLRSGRLQVVWTDEATSRLAEVLEDFRRVSRGPMWQLGLKLLSDYSFRPSIRETISRVCGLHSDCAGVPFLPVRSVSHLARHVGLAASTLSRYWRREVPLRCSLKEFLSWAVLIWALRARSQDTWNAIADQVGLQRRTLERNFMRMAECTLAAAADDPERIVRRFREWVGSVWEPNLAHRSGGTSPLPRRPPGAGRGDRRRIYPPGRGGQPTS